VQRATLPGGPIPAMLMSGGQMVPSGQFGSIRHPSIAAALLFLMDPPLQAALHREKTSPGLIDRLIGSPSPAEAGAVKYIINKDTV
jgi:hypothetical protein